MTSPQGARAAQERNAAAVDQLEAEAAVSVRAAIAAMLADVLAANGDPDDTTTPAPSVDTLAAAARQAWTRARERIVAWVRTTFRRLLTRAVDNLPDDVAPDLPPATVEQRVLTLVDQVRAGLDEVPDVLASRVTTQLRDGFAEGESPDQLRRRVADALGADEWAPEVARIARTTTTSVYNAAHSAAADDLEVRLGEPLRRLWLATRDTRTRPTHREANGQVVESGRLFRVGDALMRFPGDPLGPPEEVINCRCVVVPVVSDLVVDLAHRVTGREAAVLDDMPIAASALLAATRMPPQFVTYWTVGPGGGRIRWGTGGDFRRCQRALRRYLDTGEVNGACANLHKLATGKWPAEKSAAAEEGEAHMGCPCENEDEDLVAEVAGDPDLPLAPRDTEWDAVAAVERVWAWATGDGEEMPDQADLGEYGRAFFWRDPDADAAADAYRLPFADVIDGELMAVPAGIVEAAEMLQGGRDPDMADVRARVSAYYDRMAAEFDDDTLMAPWDAADPPADRMTDADDGEGMAAADLEEARTLAMIALIPADADATRLAVEGEAAIPAAELHVTLAFLGPGADWAGTENGDRVLELAARVAADAAPITGQVWAVAVTGEGSETGATPFYLVGDDTGRLAELHGGLLMAAGDVFPEQHSPFVAHISTRYGNADTAGMDAVGSEVTLDRVRVAFGEEVADFPLTGDDSLDLDDEGLADEAPVEMPEDEDEDLIAAAVPAPLVADLRAANSNAAVLAEAVANAPTSPSKAWFEPIHVDGPTPPTVTAQGRFWGHIGQADVCHVGIADECVTIPPSRTNYGAFHRDDLLTAEGDTVRVGYLYTGCDHSSLESTLDEARNYLSSACTATAAGRVYDTEFGPMFVGTIMAGVTARDVARLWKLSGEWFSAPLELHAAVGVEEAGFPVDGTSDDGIQVSDVDPEPALAADTGETDSDVAGAVAAYRRRAAMRTAGPAVAAAARHRADRLLAGYQRRG